MRKCKTIGTDLSIKETEILFDLYKVKIFPVINNDKLVGIVTKGDIARALPSDANTLSKWEVHYWLDAVRIEEFIKEPVTISPDTGLFEVVEGRRHQGIGRMIVEYLIKTFPSGTVYITSDLISYFESFGFRKVENGPAELAEKVQRVCRSKCREGAVVMAFRKET